MQTAASFGRYVIIEKDSLGNVTSIDESPSAASRGLKPHEQRLLVHEARTYPLSKAIN